MYTILIRGLKSYFLTSMLTFLRIYFFGGFGPVPDRHVFFQFVIDDESGSAWNNQFFGYNPQTNNWEWPYVNGEPPSPRAAHAGDKCGPQVFISGGRLKTVRKNDLYVLDMDTMAWSGKYVLQFETN